jgi:SAM-dependent methyltransferase
MQETKREFWDSRAWKGEYAGTNDLMIKVLELAELRRHFWNGADVLEVGCGNGETAIELAEQFDIKIDAFDFSDQMVAAANERTRGSRCAARVHFSVADVRNFRPQRAYDIVYSERSLINLDSWEEQRAAIERILGWLKPSGAFLMCENSVDGLERINEYRRALDLPDITPPWHNTYFREENLRSVNVAGVALADILPFSSTYYFLSRVVNAALAAQAGQQPSYDSPVNRLALKLPPIGDFAQTKLWIWRRG